MHKMRHISHNYAFCEAFARFWRKADKTSPKKRGRAKKCGERKDYMQFFVVIARAVCYTYRKVSYAMFLA